MKSFITRVISALIAFAAVLFLYFYLAEKGFKILIALAPILGGLEAAKMFFKHNEPMGLKALFYFSNLLIFGLACFFPAQATLVLGLIFVVYAALVVIFHRKFSELVDIRAFISKSLLGFVYIGILPSFAWQLIELPHGLWWFWLLLAVVFSGDIGAYAFGTLWGKTKLMPKLSPKKSLQGSIGGLLGSVGASIVCMSFMTSPANATWQYLTSLALLAGVLAQLGDFFESLLKRVANVKDSGNIMPGHGGILDRIDGVLFASPVVLIGALYLEGIL